MVSNAYASEIKLLSSSKKKECDNIIADCSYSYNHNVDDSEKLCGTNGITYDSVKGKEICGNFILDFFQIFLFNHFLEGRAEIRDFFI